MPDPSDLTTGSRSAANDQQTGQRPRTPVPRERSGEPEKPPWRVSPAPDGRGGPPPKGPMKSGISWRRFGIILLVLFTLNFFLTTLLPGADKPARISYNPTFLQELEKGNVQSISSRAETISGEFKKDVDPPGEVGTTARFSTEVPTFADADKLSALLLQQDVEINASPPRQGRSIMANLLVALLPTLLLLGGFLYLMRRAASSQSGPMAAFGRSKAKRVGEEQIRTTFADVAGIDEVKRELSEIVDMLKNPDRYKKLGARVPKGVLLSGRPGTGKTLLARATAGEANAAFFTASASEFIEMIVGVGASRVRDLFDQAKKAAPSIIFIDEIDAIGRSRSGGGGFGGGGHDEREQTLNQILTEMDGFDPSSGVVVLAATNRPDVLDPALMRAGRFDRRVEISPPDVGGRGAILEVHTRGMPLDVAVDLDAVAATTPGMVGADLANLVNEAALLAARREHETIVMSDFTDALEKILLGTERGVVMSQKERERTAYHEAGHALVGMLTEGADPVRKVSIIPRGQALGVTVSAPESDVYNYDEAYLRGKILVALGGRVAEEVVYGTITAGAESDIQHLTGIARGMVTRWGMSDAIGPVAVEPRESQGMLLPGASQVSQATQELIDQEVRRIVDGAHHDVTLLLTEHRDQLESLTRELLDRETLDEDDAYAAAVVDRIRPGDVEAEQVTVGPEAGLEPEPAA